MISAITLQSSDMGPMLPGYDMLLHQQTAWATWSRCVWDMKEGGGQSQVSVTCLKSYSSYKYMHVDILGSPGKGNTTIKWNESTNICRILHFRNKSTYVCAQVSCV